MQENQGDRTARDSEMKSAIVKAHPAPIGFRVLRSVGACTAVVAGSKAAALVANDAKPPANKLNSSSGPVGPHFQGSNRSPTAPYSLVATVAETTLHVEASPT